jgi:hypothetical protein
MKTIELVDALLRDCWLTLDGVVPIEKGRQHRDYFVPAGAKPSKEFGLDLGHVRVSTLGTNGSVLHFEFKRVGASARLIVDAIEQSRAALINLEFHSPTYILRSGLNPKEAISFLHAALHPSLAQKGQGLSRCDGFRISNLILL